MVIGVLRVSLYIHDVFNIKEKRRVIKSLLTKVIGRFNVAAAEVGEQDIWNKAIIGISCISNSSNHADSILANIVDFIEKNTDVEILDYSTETINW